MTQLKPIKETFSVKQAWVTAALVLATSALFGLAVLPHIGEQHSAHTGSAAPEFSLPLAGDIEGSRWALSAYRGRVVVLDFWALWCKPCREQMPITERLARGRSKDVVVVGVNEGDPMADVEAFVAKQRPGYDVVSDADGEVAERYQVRGLPTLVVIDRSGRVSGFESGVVPYARLERLVDEAK